MSNYPRGSEWRRWDLHVHTPYSTLNNGFGDDFNQYAASLFKKAIEKSIYVIGITDYFSIEGYKKLKELMHERGKLDSLIGEERAEKASHILLLPNIEFRSNVIVTRQDGTNKRINYHVIFSNEIDVNVIEEHFLRELKFTSISIPSGPDESWSLTIPNIVALGDKLKSEHEEFKEKSDRFVGMMNAVVNLEDVSKILNNQASRFKDRYLIIVPADDDLSRISWDGQGHQTRKLFIQKADMLFSSNPSTRDFGLGKKHPTPDDFIREFKSLKPCIHGSDAHCYEDLFDPDSGRNTWIKADPTFHGLRYLLYEPESRVFIGDTPKSITHVSQNATKHISKIDFSTTENHKDEAAWFSGTVLFNSGLVSVIGNKGSGKSALADILALVGNSHINDHYSFLCQEKFLSPKTNFGTMFKANLLWVSGHELDKRLDGECDLERPELVKYIPQNYLESICSELEESQETDFYRELMDVIYSHVDEAERLNKDTLPELIEYLTSESEASISHMIEKVERITDKIVSLEEKTREEYSKGLRALLDQRQKELSSHRANKPKEVKRPEQDPEVQKEASVISAELEKLLESISRIESEIAGIKESELLATAKIAAADRLLDRIKNFEEQFRFFLQNSKEDQEVLGLDLDRLIAIEINKRPILDIKSKAAREKEQYRQALDAKKDGSTASQLNLLLAISEEQRKKLDAPNQYYQKYLQDIKLWQNKENGIIGSEGEVNSIKGIEKRLSEIDILPNEINELERERLKLTHDIFKVKESLLVKYRELYSPVQTFIDSHPISQEYGALKIEATIASRDFIENLLNMIHQGRVGSFYGEKEGRDRLSRLKQSADFTSKEGVTEFIGQLMDNLRCDHRDSEKKQIRLEEQLRQGYNAKDLYNFLFSLSYLQPHFELRWQDKALYQLSPGERGNLLLLFYLLIDKRDVPLIIDQPEENLDNQTVANMLVPAIKEAKERRQIIMVTHNPNLAVVCDADQIIHAKLNKTAGNRIYYKSGSIENPEITQLMIDILEGTKPAFDLRDAKYSILD